MYARARARGNKTSIIKVSNEKSKSLLTRQFAQDLLNLRVLTSNYENRIKAKRSFHTRAKTLTYTGDSVSDIPPVKQVYNPFAIERPHATPSMLERQGSFRGFTQLNQASPFKRQLSLRVNDLPSNLERTRSHSLEPTDLSRMPSALSHIVPLKPPGTFRSVLFAYPSVRLRFFSHRYRCEATD